MIEGSSGLTIDLNSCVTHPMRSLMKLCEMFPSPSAEPPRPDPQHMRDAVEHALNCDDWTGHYRVDLNEFILSYLGYLSPAEIEQYDDFGSWVDVETPDDLANFRQGSFADAASDAQMPPIIVITAPDEGRCHTQIGDGRGRVNWAVAHNVRLHVWHMIHRDCA